MINFCQLVCNVMKHAVKSATSNSNRVVKCGWELREGDPSPSCSQMSYSIVESQQSSVIVAK
jgi:acyl CoA:acetate/3-ketoacid CoA transferase beta subunit